MPKTTVASSAFPGRIHGDAPTTTATIATASTSAAPFVVDAKGVVKPETSR